MTVNKFGNYLYVRTEQHRLAEPPIVTKTKGTSYKSICILTLKGIYKDGPAYLLDNNTNFYEMKITGTVHNMDISSDSILFVINENEAISPKSLIGTTINKGDVIKIYFSGNTPPSKEIYIEFVFFCSLIQNE